MATLLSCPRCGTETPIPGGRLGLRVYCRRCRTVRAARWTASGLGLLLVATGVFAVAVGGWSPTRFRTDATCACSEAREGSAGTANRCPCETPPIPRKTAPPGAALPGEPRTAPTPPSRQVKPEHDEATRPPVNVLPLGGGRLLHPGVPGLLLHLSSPVLL